MRGPEKKGRLDERDHNEQVNVFVREDKRGRIIF